MGQASSLSGERTARAVDSAPAAYRNPDSAVLALARSSDRLEACPTSLAQSVPGRARSARRRAWGGNFHSWLILPALWLLFGAGCRTATPLPPADFSAPGWTVWQGQAVWQPSSARPEMAGDLLLATNVNGNCFIQFSKMPFPLATAQLSGGQWQMEFGADKYSWHGHSPPPTRFVWFLLPHALLGADPGGNWRFASPATNVWRLKNLRTGESLEGEFSP